MKTDPCCITVQDLLAEEIVARREKKKKKNLNTYKRAVFILNRKSLTIYINNKTYNKSIGGRKLKNLPRFSFCPLGTDIMALT